MKNSLFYLWLFLFFHQPLYAADDPQKAFRKSVLLQWEATPNTTKYELELLDFKTEKSLKIFSSVEPRFKLFFRMGKYKFRARLFDEVGTASPWSETQDVMIGGEKVVIVKSPAESEIIMADRKSGKAKIFLEFDSPENLPTYRVIVEDWEAKILKEIIVKTTANTLALEPGDYKLRVEAILPDGNPGKSSDYSAPFRILGAKLDKPFMTLSYFGEANGVEIQIKKSVPESEFKGRLEFRKLESTEWWPVDEDLILKENTWRIEEFEDAGEYRLSLKEFAKGFTTSEEGEFSFVVKPTAKSLNHADLGSTTGLPAANRTNLDSQSVPATFSESID